MNDFKIQKATRRGVIPLIGIYGESGTGKSMSALLLARGLVGNAGEIYAIDTESRRLSLYADVIPGGFSVLDLEPPFTPDRYIDAMKAVISAGAKVILVDSMSHEWEGEGGILDMAGDSEEKTGRAGLHNWKKPKLAHAQLVQFLLRCPVPVVACIRAKYKTKQKRENGKTVIVKDDYTSPIQAEDFTFELTAHLETLQDHSIHLTKCSHPDLRKCFPESGPISIQHGEMIAKWCAAGGSISSPVKQDAKALKARLWKMTESKHGGDKGKLESWLKDDSNGFLAKELTLESLTEPQLENLIGTLEKFL